MQRLSVAFGRFNPITIEHEKLLEHMKYHGSEEKIVILMGAKEAPISLFDRLIYLKWLYPKFQVIPCSHGHFESIPQALYKLYSMYPEYDLFIHCGTGNAGITKKSKQGGSADEFKRIITNNNGTKWKNTEDFRMNWKSVTYIENERGNISGSFVRNLAKELDHMEEEHVELFRQFLHSRISFHELSNILRFFHS